MHRLNLNLNDELWGELQSLPKGERSRFVEQSLAHSLELRRRQQAAERHTELRGRMTAVNQEGLAEVFSREPESPIRPKGPRKPGSGKGQLLWMAPDFNATPEDFKEYS